MSSEASEFLRNLFPHGSPMAQSDLATKVERLFTDRDRVLLRRVMWLIDTLDDGVSPIYSEVKGSLEDVITGRLPLPEKRVK